ncbi:hypothetical protein BDP27DRAFT_1451797 [Rhodocollybia butyracea]|uniref:Uncharacterized protein n=1 Tax=Rhodocollybia butyracea TaxID=206335 RepID=A0A9P5PF88_9AGAR|nr:hypothetical protein BDP27DRAFT_1451797 [Rhodocollybia butyracea]
MTSIVRAYYLPAESTSTIDASHPVSVRQLNDLGWNMSPAGGGPNEIEQAGRKFAQELRFPITQEGCSVPFHFELERNAATLAPEMADILRKAAEAKNSEVCYAKSVVVAVTSGNLQIDVEDVPAAGWVRVHLAAGTLFCIPTGAKYRIPINEQIEGTTGNAFFEETISNHGLLVEKEIDSHRARQAYLKEVLGQT